MRQHGLGSSGFGHDGRFKVVLLGEKTRDAAGVVGFLIRGKQKRRIARGLRSGGNQTGRRTLDVTGTQANGTVLDHTQGMRVGCPMRRIRHGVQMHIEDDLRIATDRQEGHRTRTKIGDLDAKPRQHRPQIIEDAVRADVTWRISGIERHQTFEVGQNSGQHRGRIPGGSTRRSQRQNARIAGDARCSGERDQRLTSAQSVELMPNNLMKPSASSTPQSADCA